MNMLFKRFFKRRRTFSSSENNKQNCFCTTAKRDSISDDLSIKRDGRQSADRYGLARTDKPRRLMRRLTNLDDSFDRDDEMSISERLRRATAQCPANIPMLVVMAFHPDGKGLQKNQIEIQRGFPVNAQYIVNEWLFIKTADNDEGFVPYLCCRPMLRRMSTKMGNSYRLHDFDQAGGHSSSLNNSLTTQKKRFDVTSSSCGGDSGVSDCESSTHQETSLSRFTRRTGLVVHDVPTKKVTQLLISRNSAFTQIIRKTPRQEKQDEQSDDDETTHLSSPYIRRTPFVRRSLPQHSQPSILKKSHRPPMASAQLTFSDLSLNQIENDSLSTPIVTRFPLSSVDDSTNNTSFIHIQMRNHLGERKSASFIHNVSITV